MTALSDDERAILGVFAEANGPLDSWDAVTPLLPRKPRLEWLKRAGRRYPLRMRRRDEYSRAMLSLHTRGLLDGPYKATAITGAGREALWGPKPSGWITTDAVLSQEEAKAWRREWEKRLQAQARNDDQA